MGKHFKQSLFFDKVVGLRLFTEHLRATASVFHLLLRGMQCDNHSMIFNIAKCISFIMDGFQTPRFLENKGAMLSVSLRCRQKQPSADVFQNRCS